MQKIATCGEYLCFAPTEALFVPPPPLGRVCARLIVTGWTYRNDLLACLAQQMNSNKETSLSWQVRRAPPVTCMMSQVVKRLGEWERLKAEENSPSHIVIFLSLSGQPPQ